MNPRISTLRFISDCLAGQIDPVSAQRTWPAEVMERLDWGEIIGLANRQLVSPALWPALRDKGWGGSVPPPAADYLAALYDLNVERNRRLRQQVLRVAQALARHAIEVMPLKGIAHLLAGLYPDPGARLLGDIDLLVPAERFDDAFAVLQGLGYRTEAQNPEAFAAHHHAAPLVRDGEEAPIELHRAPVDTQVGDLLPSVSAWAGSLPFEIEGIALRILAPTDAVLQNLLHSEVVDRNYAAGVICLRALCDFALLWTRHGTQIDWPLVCRRMEIHGEERKLHAYLYLAKRLFGTLHLPTGGEIFISRLHYVRCLLKLRFPLWCSVLPQRFSAQRIRRDYACADSFGALTLARLRHAACLVKKHVGRPSGRTEKI